MDSLTQELSRRPGQAQHEELAQRAQALALLVDVQMEAEGWGRDDIRGALEGLSMQSAHGIMQVGERMASTGRRGELVVKGSFARGSKLCALVSLSMACLLQHWGGQGGGLAAGLTSPWPCFV